MPLDGEQRGAPVVFGVRFVSDRLQQPSERIRGIAVVFDDEDAHVLNPSSRAVRKPGRENRPGLFGRFDFERAAVPHDYIARYEKAQA
jgi:hypothetical protein